MPDKCSATISTTLWRPAEPGGDPPGQGSRTATASRCPALRFRKFRVSCVVAHPELHGLRRWALATADVHGLYARHGFRPPANPDIHLFIERAPADLWPPEAEEKEPLRGKRRMTDDRPTGQPTFRQEQVLFAIAPSRGCRINQDRRRFLVTTSQATDRRDAAWSRNPPYTSRFSARLRRIVLGAAVAWPPVVGCPQLPGFVRRPHPMLMWPRGGGGR